MESSFNRRVLIKDMAVEARQTALNHVSSFSVTLMGVIVSSSGKHARPIGSGTLVKIKSNHCILTAGHVIKNKAWNLAGMEPFTHLGIVFRETEHEFLIDLSSILIAGDWNLEGLESELDWAVILLPPDSIGYIKATKSFLDLERPANCPSIASLADRLAIIVGAPSEYCSESVDSSNDHQHWDIGCGVFFGGITGEKLYDGRKILEVDAILNEGYTGPSQSFAGVSGGSLWVIELMENTAGEFSVLSSEFLGVPFIEQPTMNAADNRLVKITVKCQTSETILSRLREEIG